VHNNREPGQPYGLHPAISPVCDVLLGTVPLDQNTIWAGTNDNLGTRRYIRSLADDNLIRGSSMKLVMEVSYKVAELTLVNGAVIPQALGSIILR